MQEPFQLPESMTINNVESLLSELSQLEVGDFAEGLLNGANVQEVSTAAIQALVSFHQTLQLLDGRIVLQSASPAMCKSMELLGMSNLLEEWSQPNV